MGTKDEVLQGDSLLKFSDKLTPFGEKIGKNHHEEGLVRTLGSKSAGTSLKSNQECKVEKSYSLSQGDSTLSSNTPCRA